LNPYFPTVPLTPKTLLDLQPEQNGTVSLMGEGEYVHFPWVDSLRKIIENNDTENTEKIVNLAVNVDGLPLYKNTNKYTAYPILVSAMQYPKYILTAGIYCSNKNNSKSMPDAEILLSKFVSDVMSLSNVLHTEKGVFSIALGPFICDAPVRSDLKKIVYHSGYNSCERCIQHGKYCKGHVILSKSSATARTDKNFNDRVDPGHHNTPEIESFLEKLSFPMVSGFILDYMHLACLGVMKRLIMCWKTGKTSSKKIHFSPRSRGMFDTSCLSLSKHLCNDFNRKCDGGMTNLANWKASEYRIFMLYTGIIVLSDKDIASKEVYQNFILFSVAMRFLLQESNCNNMQFVHNLLIRFIEGAIKIYGHSILSYNMHCLQHLPEDYKSYGNLDNVSAFKFESHLGTHIKGAVRAGYKPLQQITRHTINVNDTSILKKSDKKIYVHKPVKHSTDIVEGQAFKKLIYGGNFSIQGGVLGGRDNTVQLTNGGIAVVLDIIESNNNIKLVAQVFEKVENFFENPLESKHVGIF
jgi:hypothetical protein